MLLSTIYNRENYFKFRHDPLLQKETRYGIGDSCATNSITSEKKQQMKLTKIESSKNRKSIVWLHIKQISGKTIFDILDLGVNQIPRRSTWQIQNYRCWFKKFKGREFFRKIASKCVPSCLQRI